MRMSKLFSQTLRNAPSDAEVVSNKLLLRAGFIRQLAAGIYSYLPLARRAMSKIENILRDEMNAINGQEITMPVIHSADIWKETNRWYEVGSEMGRFFDKNGRDMVLAMTHEEVVADLTRKEIHSYRQLPAMIYHIQTKWRDDPRPRAGLIRVREFTMKDSYSLDLDMEGLDRQYRAHYQAYFNIFNRCALPTISVGADVGMMGGTMSHEYMYLSSVGEDTLTLCEACGYTANRQIAEFKKLPPAAEEPQSLQKVKTPDVTTIKALAEFLDIPESKTAKAIFLIAAVTEGQEDVEKFIFAIVRGDMDLNETKLANAVKAKALRPAHEDEIRAIGAEPGYGSPIGVKDALIVVDDLIPQCPNLVAGANEVEYHYLNVNYGRDYKADIVTDIVAAKEGDACPRCGSPMRVSRGVEVGNIFKLGTRYTDAMGATYLDKDGVAKPVVMGSYGIGVGRLLACVAEEHNDEHGLIWPITIAPYQVYLVNLSKKSSAAEDIYRDLEAAGVEVLFDDRDDSAGIKFNDADLIGLPIRLTVGDRSLKRGGLEMKLRRSKEGGDLIPLDEIVSRVQAQIAALEEEIAQELVEVEFKE